MIDKKYKHFNLLALSKIDIQIAHYDWLRTNRHTLLFVRYAYEIKNNPTKYRFINNSDQYESISRIFLE
jgi:hypothetical protein